MKLLSLFSDLGLEARSDLQIQDLASLLPAIASCSKDKAQDSVRLLINSKSMDFETLQLHQRLDFQLIKVGENAF